MRVSLDYGSENLPEAYALFEMLAVETKNIAGELRKNTHSRRSSGVSVAQLTSRFKRSEDNALKAFKKIFKAQIELGNFEIYSASNFGYFAAKHDLGSLITGGPNADLATKAFIESKPLSSHFADTILSVLGDATPVEILSKVWSDCKDQIGISVVNIADPYDNQFCDDELSKQRISYIAEAENINSSDLFEIVALLVCLGVESAELQAVISATSRGKVYNQGPPMLVYALDADFYEREIKASNVDPNVASTLLNSWVGNMETFLTASSSLSADQLDTELKVG